MVVSNKKMKEKVRSLFVEYLAAKETSKDGCSKMRKMSEQLDSLKEIIRSNRKRRPRPPRTRVPKSTENNLSLKSEEGNKVAEDDKKRKRGSDVGDRDGNSDGDEEKKGKNRWDNKKRKKKLKVRKRMEKMNQMENGGLENGKDVVSGGVKNSLQLLTVEKREETVDFAKKIYVGGIPYYSSEEDIRSFFDSCGTLTELDCMTFPETGKFRGIAFLTFKTEAAAKRALALDGADMGGFYLKVQPYNKSSRSATKSENADFAPDIVEGYNRIYAGNLSWDVTENDLKELLSDCKVASIRFGVDKETDEFKGYAHIDFKDNVSLAMALKLDQKVVSGRPVRIRCAVPLAKKGQSNDDNGNGFGSKLVEQASAFKDNRNDDISKPQNNDVSGDTTVEGASKGKNKRRTCYECGVPGHLSSACPQKKTPGVGESGADLISNEGEKSNAYEDNDGATDLMSVAVSNASNAKKNKRRTCYECGIPGHLSSECPKKKTTGISENGADMNSNEVYKHENSNAYEDNGNNRAIDFKSEAIPNASKAKKNKRRTCYECGVPGHLSSECPKKKTSGISENGADMISNEVYMHGKSCVYEDNENSGATDLMSEGVPNASKVKKNKRRTCYECGILGHLSSECPQKKGLSSKSEKEQGNAIEGDENRINSISEQAKISTAEPPTLNASKVKKDKRRTCYQCGIPGHLSSECLQKKTINPEPDEEQGNDAKKGHENKEVDLNISEQTAAIPNVGKGKKKRRTCYACGIPGHLSAECPQKNTTTFATMGGVTITQ